METKRITRAASARNGSRSARVEVTVGGRPDAHLTHIINAPRRVWFKPAIGTADEAIEIESEDEATTLVHFPYVPPEQGERQLPGR